MDKQPEAHDHVCDLMDGNANHLRMWLNQTSTGREINRTYDEAMTKKPLWLPDVADPLVLRLRAAHMDFNASKYLAQSLMTYSDAQTLQSYFPTKQEKDYDLSQAPKNVVAAFRRKSRTDKLFYELEQWWQGTESKPGVAPRTMDYCMVANEAYHLQGVITDATRSIYGIHDDGAHARRIRFMSDKVRRDQAIGDTALATCLLDAPLNMINQFLKQLPPPEDPLQDQANIYVLETVIPHMRRIADTLGKDMENLPDILDKIEHMQIIRDTSWEKVADKRARQRLIRPGEDVVKAAMQAEPGKVVSFAELRAQAEAAKRSRT